MDTTDVLGGRAPTEESSTAQAIDELLARATEAGEVPGVVALSADRSGVSYEGAFGYRALGSHAAMTLDTVFAIASMTKAITAVAALQFLEQGRLTLDEPVVDRYPELGAVQVLDGFDADGAPRLRAPRRAITLRHLLTHTAGFGYAAWSSELFRFQQHLGSPPGFQAPLLFDPGERWLYGTNIDWVGRLVERLSGLSLEAYFREHILDPLGMVDTSFVLGPDQRARLVGSHQRRSDGSLTLVEPTIPSAPAFFNGGGGLYSTGPDYLRFTRMLLAGGELDGRRVLQPESVAEFTRNHIGELNVEVLRSVIPERSNDVDLFPGVVCKWGLGGLINTAETDTGRSANSWAWGGLSNTFFWIDPTRGISGVFLTQILPFCDPAALDLFRQFEAAVYAGQRAAR